VYTENNVESLVGHVDSYHHNTLSHTVFSVTSFLV